MQLTFPSALMPASLRSHLALLPWLASLLIILLVPTALRAETYTIPGTNITLTYSLSGNPATATITDCNTDVSGTLAIPDTLGSAPVTSIGSYAFDSSLSLTSVIIPNSVTSIGSHAFSTCRKLTSVTIPNSITSIGDSAFSNCLRLTSVTIPNSVTSIGDSAFSNCTSLTSVTIPNSVTSIDSTFSGCTSLTSVTIPNSITSIDSAFSGCTSLTSVTIPNSVTSVGDYAFYTCTSLTSVTIPNSITSIGDYAFASCTSLTSVTFAGIAPTSFGSNVFYNAAPEFTIFFANGASGFSTPTWQGYPAQIYEDGRTAQTITFAQPADRLLGDGPFTLIASASSGLPVSFTVLSGPATLSGATVTLLTSSGTVTIRATQVGDTTWAVAPYVDRSFKVSASFADVAKALDQAGANGSTSGNTIWGVDTTRTNDGVDAARSGSITHDQSSVLTLSVSDATAIYFQWQVSSESGYDYLRFSIDGVEQAKISGEMYWTQQNYALTSGTHTLQWSYTKNGSVSSGSDAGWVDQVVLPSVFTVPGTNITLTYRLNGDPTTATIDNCNDNATGALAIPNSLGGAPVTSIGHESFSGCASLTSVSIPNSVTSIGYDAFSGCTSLTSFTIPNSVNSISDSTFNYCTSLTSITIPNSVTSIGKDAFQNCTSLTSVTIPNSVTAIGPDAFSGCTSLTSVTIPNSVTSIDAAFSGCTSLASVTIPSSVTAIGYAAFYNCTSLASVTIPSSVTSIGNSAFRSCSSLTSITIPNSVTYIDSDAFNECTSLTSITIPNSVISIGNYAFNNCTSLTSVTIPNSVTSIGAYAFTSCRSLTNVTIPNNVTSIGYATFTDCTRLTAFIVDSANNAYSSLDGVLFNKAKTELIQYPIAKTASTYSIPNNVTSIDDYAFYYCTNLTAFVVDPANSAYSSLDGVLFNKAITELIQYPIAKTASIYTIPNSVTAIGYSAFSSCANLTSVTIPNSVTSIGDYAFEYCPSMTDFIVDPDNSAYSSLDGVLFSKTQSRLIQYPSARTGFTYTIPNSVTTIEDYSFSDCASLTSITISSLVTYIGDYAFEYCTGLHGVSFAGNAPTKFGRNVFYNTAPDFTIYYPPGASGFTTPTWKGYPTQPTLFYSDTTYAVGGGWKWNGLGFFYDGFYPFLWLPQPQKWLYLVGSDEDSFYFFDFTRSYWGWTARAYYPLGVMLDGPQNGAWVEL